MSFRYFNERAVCLLPGFPEDPIEIPNGLVVMDTKDKSDGICRLRLHTSESGKRVGGACKTDSPHFIFLQNTFTPSKEP